MHYLIETYLLHARNSEIHMGRANAQFLCVLGGDSYQPNRNAEVLMLWASHKSRRYW